MAAFHWTYRQTVAGEGYILCDGGYTDGLGVYLPVIPAWLGRLGTGAYPYYYDLGKWAVDRDPANDAGYPATPIMVVDGIDSSQSGAEVNTGSFVGDLHFPLTLVAYYRMVGHKFFWWIPPGVAWDIYALSYF